MCLGDVFEQPVTTRRGVILPGCSGLVLMLVLGSASRTTPISAAPTEDAPLEKAIRKAGETDDDSRRLSLLREMARRADIPRGVRSDAEKLAVGVERWLEEPRLDYFGREVSRSLDYDFGISEESPLHPLTFLYRGRMLTWYTLESGGVWNQPERRRRFLDRARHFFERYAEAFPKGRIARMYLGQPLQPRVVYAAVEEAPDWATEQREALERLSDIIEWWIDHRMRPNGEYGGGWGDDCEMWRWWIPVLIGFDTPKITEAQARFSRSLLDQPHMRLGYTTRMSDVEHTAEDSADALTPMMHLDPSAEDWKRRALRLAELMESRWTGINRRGYLQFKSTYFTAQEVDDDPRRACDTVYHPRAVQPALLYWQRTSDERLTRLFATWMETWVDAARRTERGKPKGILPTAIHWPDGRVGGVGPDWWDPRNHAEHTLYLYPSALGMMLHTLLLTHHMTGREEYLEPIRSLARRRLEYLREPPAEPPQPGTAAWCAARPSGLISAVAKYRFLTGRDEFDKLLEMESHPSLELMLHGGRDPLERALRRTAAALRINFDGYTSEVRYTDRVLRFPTIFGHDAMFRAPLPGFHSPDTTLLYSTVTGDPGSALYFPLNAVRWLTPARKIAALVTESGRDRFAAELFHFGSKPRSLTAELYLLKAGDYRYALESHSNSSPTASAEILSGGRWRVASPRARLSLELPPRRLCRLRIESES